MHISREEQRKRISELWENKDTTWRVTGDDLWQQEHYDAFLKAYDQFMEDTGEITPWHVLDASSRKKYVLDGLRVLAATAGLILMPFIASAAACAERACPARLSSPVSRRVRLND